MSTCTVIPFLKRNKVSGKNGSRQNCVWTVEFPFRRACPTPSPSDGLGFRAILAHPPYVYDMKLDKLREADDARVRLEKLQQELKALKGAEMFKMQFYANDCNWYSPSGADYVDKRSVTSSAAFADALQQAARQFYETQIAFVEATLKGLGVEL